MKEVVDNCPLCHEQHFEIFETHEDVNFVLTYQICVNCGLVFQSPHMSTEELAEFYISEYRQLAQGTEEPTEKDLRIQAGRARYLLQVTSRVVPKIARHLDIGSSSGALIIAFKKFYQCDSVGVEPGNAYRNKSRVDGIEVHPSLLDLDTGDKGGFDLISMAHVLEHLPNPILYLNQLKENWMTPEGYLIIEVPNIFGHRSIELSHLFLFSPRTLRQVITLAGFKVLRLFTHGNPRSPILKLYITAIAQAQPNARHSFRHISSSSGVRSRRILGMWLHRFLTRFLPGWAWKALPELHEKE